MTVPTSTSSGGIARVTFRVRCETLGHGECVYLHQDGCTGQVSLHTQTSLQSPIY